MNTYKNRQDDIKTDAWIKSIGLNAQSFNSTKIPVLRAQMTANTLLAQHRALLTARDIHSLTDFLKAAESKREREHITPAFCHCVMNISTRINRKLFKQYRKLSK